MIEVAKYGNIASKSDVEVGVRAMEMGIWGAYKNVQINLPGIKDAKFVKEINDKSAKIKDRAKQKMDEILKILDKRSK
jgi:glutamate formiminotransferase/formiminotetrahydrofolate cyclodeaminase